MAEDRAGREILEGSFLMGFPARLSELRAASIFNGAANLGSMMEHSFTSRPDGEGEGFGSHLAI